ncbi:T9SS type A sorting domain-containing protein [Flavobacterium sp.]|uniref:T9SS type A sorting domain-containing protein n=1 Tax=Flavobacterium sp. TaxID=239 RepID=UPI003340ACFE
MINFKTIFKALLLYFIFCNLSQAQRLHHQMISCQGGNSSNTSVASVSFTVGQQSVIGTATNGISVQQGFQQSNWGKIMQQNTLSLNTTVFPNPFKDVVNFSFSKSPGNDISIVVFDLFGRLVYSDVLKNEDNLVSVNLNNLSTAEYFVKLTSNNYIFSTKILKQ